MTFLKKRSLIILLALLITIAGCVGVSPNISSKNNTHKIKRKISDYEWNRTGTVNKDYDQILTQEKDELATIVAYPKKFQGTLHKRLRFDIQIHRSLQYILWIKVETDTGRHRLMKASKLKKVDGDYYFREDKNDAVSIYLDLNQMYSKQYKFEMAFITSDNNVVMASSILGIAITDHIAYRKFEGI